MIAGVVLSCASAVFSQEQSFQLNAETTEVHFTLGATMHSVHGTFKAKSGSIRFDPQTGAASGTLVIDATSGESGNGDRDHKMHTEVLESQKYPEISFSATKIVGKVADGSSLQVEGVFHIHGGEHPLVLSAPLVIHGDEVTAKFHFVIPYVAWGLKNPSTFVLRVSKEVEIDVAAAGRLSGTPK